MRRQYVLFSAPEHRAHLCRTVQACSGLLSTGSGVMLASEVAVLPEQAILCVDAAERDAHAALCGGAPAVRAAARAHEQRGLLVR